MPVQENQAIVRAFFEKVLNAVDLSGLDDFSHAQVAVPQAGSGPEVFRKVLSEARGSLSNPEYKILDMISEGEKVAVRFSAKGVNTGRYMGLPATGKTLSLWGVMIFRFEAGAIAEFWQLVETQGVLRQLRGV